jgi:hypothetical protein
MTARLMRALTGHVLAVTSYFESTDQPGTTIAPLGASLEAGWATNVFGGPCFAATGKALSTLRHVLNDSFDFWPAYAALTCNGLETGLVTEPLFAAPSPPDAYDGSSSMRRPEKVAAV